MDGMGRSFEGGGPGDFLLSLRDLTAQFRDAYFTAEGKKHLEEHKAAPGDNLVTEKKPEAVEP